jgi:hypothetical protein
MKKLFFVAAAVITLMSCTKDPISKPLEKENARLAADTLKTRSTVLVPLDDEI